MQRSPRVVTIHDLVWKYARDTMRPLPYLLERYQMPLAIGRADMVVADSAATSAAVIDEFSLAADKLRVVSLAAITSNSVVAVESWNLLGLEEPYFLFVGTLEPRKNLLRLLTAYAELPQSIRLQAQLVVAGGSGWGGLS